MVVTILVVNSILLILLMGEFRVEKVWGIHSLDAPSLCFTSNYSANARECEQSLGHPGDVLPCPAQVPELPDAAGSNF